MTGATVHRPTDNKMYQQSVRRGCMGVVNINPSLLWAVVWTSLNSTYWITLSVWKSATSRTEMERIFVLICKCLHLWTVSYYNLASRTTSVSSGSCLFIRSATHLSSPMSCRMWRYSEHWSWASWKEGKTSTRPCASSLVSAAMRSSPASPWLVSDRYDTADQPCLCVVLWKNKCSYC